MFRLKFCVLLISVGLLSCRGQEYDFEAEITRQCLVPDPVGLLDCVENKVTLPYLTSWVDCTNSLGENVKTSSDIINYRCKSVWEGKKIIPEVFYIKDCVIEKTGLPAKNVSAEVLGAYKECESGASNPQRTKTAPVQQQQLRASSVEYKPITQVQSPAVQQLQQPSQPQNFVPRQQFQVPIPPPVQPQLPITIQGPSQQIFQGPAPRHMHQQFQAPAPLPVQQTYQVPAPRPVQQQYQVPAPRPVQQQQFQAPAPRPVQQPYQIPAPRPVQQQFQVQTPRPMQQQFIAPATRPMQQQVPVTFQQQFQATPPRPIQSQVTFQQSPVRVAPVQQVKTIQLTQQQVPVTLNQQNPSATSRAQYQAPGARSQSFMMPASAIQRQPYSQQYFAIYPQTAVQNQQYTSNQPIQSQKTVTSPSYVSQQQVDTSRQITNANGAPNMPYMYSFQINHPQRSVF